MEMLFSKFKQSLRKTTARTEQAIYNAVVDLLPTATSTECENYFAIARHART
jgi:hypothetical protein